MKKLRPVCLEYRLAGRRSIEKAIGGRVYLHLNGESVEDKLPGKTRESWRKGPDRGGTGAAGKQGLGIVCLGRRRAGPRYAIPKESPNESANGASSRTGTNTHDSGRKGPDRRERDGVKAGARNERSMMYKRPRGFAKKSIGKSSLEASKKAKTACGTSEPFSCTESRVHGGSTTRSKEPGPAGIGGKF